MVFAGAATIATLALFSAAQPGDAGTAVASGSVPATAPVGLQAAPAGASPVVVDVDDGGVNDNGQTSGDIFTQNAQDQSTANGAGNVTRPHTPSAARAASTDVARNAW